MIRIMRYMFRMLYNQNLRRLYKKISYRDAIAVYCSLFYRR